MIGNDRPRPTRGTPEFESSGRGPTDRGRRGAAGRSCPQPARSDPQPVASPAPGLVAALASRPWRLSDPHRESSRLATVLGSTPSATPAPGRRAKPASDDVEPVTAPLPLSETWAEASLGRRRAGSRRRHPVAGPGPPRVAVRPGGSVPAGRRGAGPARPGAPRRHGARAGGRRGGRARRVGVWMASAAGCSRWRAADRRRAHRTGQRRVSPAPTPAPARPRPAASRAGQGERDRARGAATAPAAEPPVPTGGQRLGQGPQARAGGGAGGCPGRRRAGRGRRCAARHRSDPAQPGSPGQRRGAGGGRGAGGAGRGASRGTDRPRSRRHPRRAGAGRAGRPDGSERGHAPTSSTGCRESARSPPSGSSNGAPATGGSRRSSSCARSRASASAGSPSCASW